MNSAQSSPHDELATFPSADCDDQADATCGTAWKFLRELRGT